MRQKEFRRVVAFVVTRLEQLGLDELEDPRSARGKRWRLRQVIATCLLGMLAGCKSLTEVVLEERRFALAVSDLPAPILLELAGGAAAPVRERALLARIERALAAIVRGESQPVLRFEAVGAAGKLVSYAGARLVALEGESFLVGVAPDGSPQAFFAHAGEAGRPERVTDATPAARVLASPAEADRAASAPQATLVLPSGEERTLALVEHVQVGDVRYAVGVDRDEAGQAHVLRDSDEGLMPVSDEAELARVQAALRGEG